MPTDLVMPLQIQARNLEKSYELQTNTAFDADLPTGGDAGDAAGCGHAAGGLR